jgi:hypothetical protein
VFTARYVLPKLCIFCGSENKQRLFHCIALSDCFFITETECVYCAVRPAHKVYLFVFCGSQNKQRLFHCTALSYCFYNLDGVCLLRGTFCPHSVCFYKRGGVFNARYVLPKQCIYEPLFHCTTLSDWFYNRE